MKRRELLARQPSYCKILNDLKEIFNIYNLFSSTLAPKYRKKHFKMASQKKWRHVLNGVKLNFFKSCFIKLGIIP